MMKIEQWALVYKQVDPYMAPELHRPMVSGVVYGNPNFEDGANVTTSTIKETKFVDGKLVCLTVSGSIYELGEVSPEYEAAFPGAKERAIKAAMIV